MKDFREVQSQLERALGTLMDAVEQQPDADLAEAVDHISAALTRLRASEIAEAADTQSEHVETDVAPEAAHLGRRSS